MNEAVESEEALTVKQRASLDFVRGAAPSQNPYPAHSHNHMLWAYWYGEAAWRAASAGIKPPGARGSHKKYNKTILKEIGVVWR